MNVTIAKGLTVFLLVVHLALSAVDFFGVYPVADFMLRPDGSRQDPNSMEPFEEIFVAMIAFPFFIVALGFILVSNQKEAAALSVAVHGIYAIFQLWKKDKWDDLVHPESDTVNTNFFIVAHVFWSVVSVLIWALSENSSPKGTKND